MVGGDRDGDVVGSGATLPTLMLGPKPAYDIALLPGDGIGAEVAAEARALVEAMTDRLGVGLRFDEIPCGGRYFLEHGREHGLEHGDRDWPEDGLARCKAADVILLGAVGWNHPDGTLVQLPDGRMAGWSPVIGNRVRLKLYANIRPIRLLAGVQHGQIGRAHV